MRTEVIVAPDTFSEKKYSSFEQYARTVLNGDDYGIGQLEAACRTAENNSEAIGRLVGILFEKGLLTGGEACEVISGYHGEIEVIKQ